MTSAVRYYSFKDIPGRENNLPSPSFCFVFRWSRLEIFEIVLAILACSYALIGIVLHVVRAEVQNGAQDRSVPSDRNTQK